MNSASHKEVVVIGAGPGGYAAAFRAADLGKKVLLIDRDPVLGGVCLNRGCIPSKALLHIAKVIRDARELRNMGVRYGEPEIDLNKIRKWKERVVGRLNRGVGQLARTRNVETVQGNARFISPGEIAVTSPDGEQRVGYDDIVIATGSRPVMLPGLPDDDRIWSSTDALALSAVPPRLLVVGGGYIGLEMGTAYQALGSSVTVVEFMDSLLPGADPALVQPLARDLQKKFKKILLNTKVAEIQSRADHLNVRMENSGDAIESEFDAVLISVGRKPNTEEIGLESAGIQTDDRGFIRVDEFRRTSTDRVYAIGDVTGDPMLAHKATHEGKVAAEVIAGKKSAFEPAAVPAVIFTDPEIAWAGLTETQAQKDNIPFELGEFPWSASGRALTLGRTEGRTRILSEPNTGKVLGVGITGPGAGDLIGEGMLAIEMGADVDDLALTIHPHPTLTETVAGAAEMISGTITDLMPQAKL